MAMPIQRSEAGIDPCSLTEFSGADQEVVGGLLDDLGAGRGSGFAASVPDGDGEAGEVLSQGIGIGTCMEACPEAIAEARRPQAFEGSRCWQWGGGDGLGSALPGPSWWRLEFWVAGDKGEPPRK